ncbi:hypothetical protein [Kitasatospora sp. NPDC008115]|uniref:hypothetical protein n=1 Tax=Kitasatospora sp. NPDC008115 TaxID=3364022 RepID=UPI0036E3EA31
MGRAGEGTFRRVPRARRTTRGDADLARRSPGQVWAHARALEAFDRSCARTRC